MNTNSSTIETLNDLIRINNDRVVGYQRAIEDVENVDVDLKSMFGRMADQSLRYEQQLRDVVVRMGGEPEEDTRLDGKLFRMWMDLKAVFTGHDRQAALNSCERGEDAIQKAYDEALATDAHLSTEVRQLIMEQKTELKQSHDLIKKYRDLHRNVAA